MQILSTLSAIVFIIAYIPYICAVVRGETRPQKTSWIIWGALDSITFTGMFARHSVNGQITAAVIGTWTVATLALKYGKPGWTWLDKFCLLCAALAIVLWQVFDSPTIGLTTSLTAMFIGSVPTFQNAWGKPGEEDKLAWTLYWISCLLAVAAVPSWSLDDAAQPITFLAIESTMMFILFVKPRLISTAT